MTLYPSRSQKAKSSFILLIIFQLLSFSLKAQLRQIHQESNADNQVQKLDLYSANEGFVAFTNGIVYTTDSGRTYTVKTITTSNVNFNGFGANLTFGFGISGVKAFDKNNLLVFGDYGLVPSILSSTDGGNTFKLIYNSQYSPTQLSTGIMDMSFPQSDNTGYAIDADRVLKTTDKGQTWSVVRNDPNSYFSFIEAIDDNTIFVFSTRYGSQKLLKTTDGGDSWQQLTIPAGQINYATFYSVNSGWIEVQPSGGTSTVYSTTNGGASWTQTNATLGAAFTKMKFINDSTGFATVGFDVYKSSDAGKIWELLPRDNTFSYLGYGNNDLQILGTQLWAGGGHGFLQLGLQYGGNPLPKAFFTIDTTGFAFTSQVKANNQSKPGYSSKWYVNHVLTSQNYNLSYTHTGLPLMDTIQLVVSNGSNSDTATQYQNFPSPILLTSFQPTKAGAGTMITIKGSNFYDVNSVSFGGTPSAGIYQITDTSILVRVGAGASGDIVVASPYTRASISGFTFIPPPVITSFTPTTGVAGDNITITGTDFTYITSLTLGSTPFTDFTIVSPTQITAHIPSSAPALITAVSPGGTGVSTLKYVETPVIKSFSPDHGTSGTVLTIGGTGLTGASSLTIGGTAVRSYTVKTADTIVCAVGQGTTGAVSVTTDGGTTSFGSFNYIPPPVITTFSPASGPVGTAVTITGTGFSATPANNTIYFGAVKATNITAASTTSLTVVVPAGASWQPISVTTNTYTAYSTTPFLVTFPNGGSLSTKSFADPLRIATGTGYSNTTSVVAADLDGDGWPDLVAANLANSGISVMRNSATPGSLSYDPKSDYAIGSGANGVWTADVDGDGKIDVIASASDDGTITILRNTSVPGTITFAAPITLTGGLTPRGVVATDIDGDGRPDIVLTSYSYPNNTIAVYLNNGEVGKPSFYPVAGFTYTTGQYTSVCDVDGDGKADLVAANATSATLTVLRNTSTSGNISFGPQQLSLPTSFPYMVATGDIDGDGKPDLACVNANGSGISLFRNTSAGSSITFDNRIDLPTLTSPVCIGLTDLDGDGQLDMIIVSQTTDGKVRVYKNLSHKGQLLFGTGIDFPVGTIPMALATADLNLDGKNDIITTGNNTGLAILVNQVVAEPYVADYTPKTAITGTAVTITGRNFTSATAVSFQGVAATSFTINSDTSITAIVGAGATGSVIVTNPYGQDSAAGFTYGAVPSITSFSPLTGAVGSTLTINGTNFNPNDPANQVTIGGIRATILSATDHTFTVKVPAGTTYAPITVTTNTLIAYSNGVFSTLFPGAKANFDSHSFAPRQDHIFGGMTYAADLDGDGKMDLLSVGSSNNLFISPNTSSKGKITFADSVSVSVGIAAGKFIAGDLDGDGKPDIVSTDAQNGLITVVRNTSTPGHLSFTSPLQMPSGSSDFNNVNELVITDIDNDGKSDIIVSSYEHILSVFHNTTLNGVLSFERLDYETGTYATGVTVADLDGDGKKDIALSVNPTGAAIFRNTSSPGAVSFDTRIDITLNGSWPEFISSGDLDGDGKIDLLVPFVNSSNVAMLSNKSTPGTIAFGSETDIAANNGPWRTALGDLDGDGKPDLSVQGNYPDPYSAVRYTSVYKNIGASGSPAFQSKVDYALQDNSSMVGGRIVDLDGDGRPDLLTFGLGTSIFRNQIGLPYIDSLTPKKGSTGTPITIIGFGFTGATSVSFGGTAASSFKVNSDTSITAVVGTGATGDVTVTTASDTVTISGFTYIAPPPAPTITLIGSSSLCQGSYDTLQSSATTGNQWYKDGVALSDTTATLRTGNAGVYTVKVTLDGLSSAASDGVQLVVLALPPTPTITADSNILISSADAGNQWYIDTTQLIVGATDKEYIATQNAIYTVRITADGCLSAFSAPYTYPPPTITTPPTTSDSAMQVMPNPASDYIKVTWSVSGETVVNAEVVDFNGNVLLTQSGVHSGDKINTANLPKGYYVLKIISPDGKVRMAKPFGRL